MPDSIDARVRAAAIKSLGDGVQEIWQIWRTRGIIQSEGAEWGWRLLELLGNDDDQSSIDILNKPCHTIVSICIENELPEHLIKCLRMLRVFELQRARNGAGTSISTRATAKVSKLLCRLCADSSVGEQLRGHLFGLLSLPGSSYPVCGLHVAVAASAVIVAYSEHCLSSPLVEFLHDRKMIVHMTEDIKELCGMSENASPSAKYCLYGDAAEEAGLWVVAFRAVVNLVVHSSLHHQERLLMEDFQSAGGEQVLSYAIERSNNPQHAKELVELQAALTTGGKNQHQPSNIMMLGYLIMLVLGYAIVRHAMSVYWGVADTQ